MVLIFIFRGLQTKLIIIIKNKDHLELRFRSYSDIRVVINARIESKCSERVILDIIALLMYILKFKVLLKRLKMLTGNQTKTNPSNATMTENRQEQDKLTVE